MKFVMKFKNQFYTVDAEYVNIAYAAMIEYIRRNNHSIKSIKIELHYPYRMDFIVSELWMKTALESLKLEESKNVIKQAVSSIKKIEYVRGQQIATQDKFSFESWLYQGSHNNKFIIDVIFFTAIIVGSIFVLSTMWMNRNELVSADLEGHWTSCFDSKGVEWISVYPVNYILNGSEEFKNAQVCSSNSESRKFRIKVDGLKGVN